MGTWDQVTCRVATTQPDLHRMRIASRGSFGAGPRYQHLTAFGCNLFLLFTLRKPGFRKGNGLLDGGEPNHISLRDLYPGLDEVAVQCF